MENEQELEKFTTTEPVMAIEEKNKTKNFLKKIKFKKVSWDKNFRNGFLVSFFTFILLLIIGFGVVWRYRANVFSYFAKGYLNEAQTKSDNSGVALEKIINKQSILSQESLVTSAVKQANPAVVSIILSKTPSGIFSPDNRIYSLVHRSIARTAPKSRTSAEVPDFSYRAMA
jgi:hypothetical protein